MGNHLTDNNFWRNFWESKKDLIFEITSNYTFYEPIGQLIKERNIKTGIEIGGFPGYYSIFLKKYFHLKTTLFDYFIHPQIIQELLSFNGLKADDIKIVEADLFAYQPDEKYDLVSSFGLIEHFEDTRDIIQRHLNFLNPEGTLFVTLPNFTGLNGWVQKTFDFANYEKHNIKCMQPQLLKNIAEELGLKEVNAYYYGGFSTWLENKNEKSLGTKLFVKAIWYAGKLVTKLLNFESKFFSPYIVLEAKK